MQPIPTLPRLSDEQIKRIEYFERHAIPQMTGHLTARSTGLQIFTAIQGGLLVAASRIEGLWTVPSETQVGSQPVAASSIEGLWPFLALFLLGLASCLAFSLWDLRNRRIFEILREKGEEWADKPLFGIAKDGTAEDGVHKILGLTLAESGEARNWVPERVPKDKRWRRLWPLLRWKDGFKSHTWAIRLMIRAASAAWLVLLVVQIVRWVKDC